MVIGLGGITWKDVVAVPEMYRIFRHGATANVTLRDRNHPGDIYASIGAGNRIQTGLDAGEVFGLGEELDPGTAFGRTDKEEATARTIFKGVEALAKQNEHTLIDGSPGSLGDELAAAGTCSAAIGNADRSIGPVSDAGKQDDDGRVLIDSGIHREVALAAMRSDGSGVGSLSRRLLLPDPTGPFGLKTNQEELITQTERALERCRVVFVEIGETTRADAYSSGLAEEVRDRYREQGLRRAAPIVEEALSRLGLDRTTVILLSTSSPGGIEARSQFHPMAVISQGIGEGTLTSLSTRRKGLLWAPDVTALIRDRVGIAQQGHAHLPSHSADPDAIGTLTALADRAYAHDLARPPLNLATSALSAVIYVLAAWLISKGRWIGIMDHLLIGAMSFPLVSYASRYGVWRAGPLAIAATAVAGAAVASLLIKRMTKDLRGAAFLILVATVGSFVIDLILGTPSQIDSTFGYSPISAGRFFGLGNLGFALLSASALLSAGMIASRRNGYLFAVALLAISVALVGVPQLGGDVGGTLALGAAATYLAIQMKTNKRASLKAWVLMASSAIGLVVVFGLIDLSRPPEAQTHLGAFLSQVKSDPAIAVEVFMRKATTALSLAINSRWGMLAPLLIVILVVVSRRAPRWGALREQEHEMAAAYRALLLGAALGTLLNDSGVAIGAMMIAVAVPWALMMLAPGRGDGPSASAP